MTLLTVACGHCGADVTRRRSEIRTQKVACSRSCLSELRRLSAQAQGAALPPWEQRFWSKVNKDGPTHPRLGTPCWLWTAAIANDGYGQLAVNRKHCLAHRLSFKIANGGIPDGLRVLHRCDNPPCVNPAHLYAGTDRDNARDRDQRGRAVVARGERNSGCKLNEAKVREIREFAAQGRRHSAIGSQFGVSSGTIDQIVSRRSWRHVA